MWRSWPILADVTAPTISAISWGFAIIAVVVVGGALLMRYRAKLMNKELSDESPGFGLSDLRAMRDRGDLTDEEYEAARAKIVGKVKETVGAAPGELTLPQIREMLDRGELTAEQYEVERKKITERLKGRG